MCTMWLPCLPLCGSPAFLTSPRPVRLNCAMAVYHAGSNPAPVMPLHPMGSPGCRLGYCPKEEVD